MMNPDTTLGFYDALGFAETEIEDGLTALFYETDPDGSYALLTDENGVMPESLKLAVVLACYTREGSFQWSASFKSSNRFKEIWSEPKTIEAKLAAVQKHRAENDYYK